MKSTHGAVWIAPHGARRATLALLMLLATAGIMGCGGSRSTQSIADSEAGTSAAEPLATATQVNTVEAQSVALGGESAAVPADSLPPDVTALASNSVAAPGAMVEIAARATPDVVEVSLWDGLRRPQSFAYDSTAGLWRARYRVPLGAQPGRLGLSVIARNGLELRHRVWVFVQVEHEAQEVAPEATPDSGLAPTSGS